MSRAVGSPDSAGDDHSSSRPDRLVTRHTHTQTHSVHDAQRRAIRDIIEIPCAVCDGGEHHHPDSGGPEEDDASFVADNLSPPLLRSLVSSALDEDYHLDTLPHKPGSW